MAAPCRSHRHCCDRHCSGCSGLLEKTQALKFAGCSSARTECSLGRAKCESESVLSGAGMTKKALALSFTVVVVIAASIGVFVQGQSINHQLSVPQTLEDRALACLTQVYPVDLNHYNVSLRSCDTLSSTQSDNSTTQAVDYMLNSPDSNLVAVFLFKDAVLYSLNLGVINGSVVASRSYANLAEAAKDFLVKYQAFSGVDSSELIQVLDKLDEAQGTSVTVGDVGFRISSFALPDMANTTTFRWLYANNTAVTLDFYDDFHDNRGVFAGFFDCRQL
jgi:hypothetical protein